MKNIIGNIKNIPEQITDESILGNRGCEFKCEYCFYYIGKNCKIVQHYDYKGEITGFRQMQIEYIMDKLKLKRMKEILTHD